MSMMGEAGEGSSHVGKYCNELKIDSEVLHKGLSGAVVGWERLNALSLVQGVVAEIDKWCKDHKYNVDVIPNLLDSLFDVGEVETANPAVKMRVRRAIDSVRKAHTLRGKSRAEQIEVIERKLFTLPHTSRTQRQMVEALSTHAEAEGRDIPYFHKEIAQVRSERDRLRDRLEIIRLEKDEKLKELNDTKEKLKFEFGRTRALKTQLKRNAKKNKDLQRRGDELVKCVKAAESANKLSTLCVHGLKKVCPCRLRRTRKKGKQSGKSVESRASSTSTRRDVASISEAMVELLNASLIAELQRCQENLEAAQLQVKNMRKEMEKMKVHKERVSKLRNTVSQAKYRRALGRRKFQAKLQEEREKARVALKAAQEEKRGLKRKLKELEYERELEEELDKEGPKAKTFKTGKKYDANIRSVYHDLLMNYGVSAKNCEGVVKTVLENLTSMEVPKLPKKSIAASMYLEGRKMAQIQVAESLLQKQDMTLASDATTKFGHHYTSYDVYAGEGSSELMIGMRETDDGTAATTVQTLKTILEDVVGKDKDKETQNQAVNTVLANIKNTMSDRHIVQKKFNELLKDYRQTILPSIIQGWDSMSEGERDQFVDMNNFFCGLHYLVGLADYAGKTLVAWEGMIFGDTKMGAAALDDVHTASSESGTERLVRNVCKSVQDRACERSGKPVQFRTFLKSKGISTVPLSPFKGNRFNILFHNGAGVAYLRRELQAFFDTHKDDNLLMEAVHEDLGVNQYIAGARALGLIDKLVTGPLWRVINQKGHVANMNDSYRAIHESFSRWSSDSSEFMLGNDLMFDDLEVHEDEVYQSLVRPDPELDAMTKQILEMVFSTFCRVTEKLLVDHLPSGSHAAMSERKMKETASVPRTNVGVERDFGMLDRLMRLKPSASTMVFESVIMHVKNRTSEWRKGLSEEKLEEYMEYSRKSVQAQRKEYANRVKTLWDNREAKREKQKQIAREREEKNKLRTEKVNASVRSKCGRIWLTETEVNTELEGVDDKCASEMLQSQLQARRHVLGEKNTQGNLNITVKGKKKSVLELKQSLIDVIKAANGRAHSVEEMM